MSAAPKGRNILAQGAALGREGPSPRLRPPSPARAGEGKGEREGASTQGWRPGLCYVAPSELNSEAEFLNELLTQDTSRVRMSAYHLQLLWLWSAGPRDGV
jgi:hypothetical protein